MESTTASSASSAFFPPSAADVGGGEKEERNVESNARFVEPPDDETFEKCTVQQLKIYLRARGAHLTGRRDDLVERAKFYHADPKLREIDVAGSRRRQKGKRKSARASAVHSIIDDELELQSDPRDLSNLPPRPDFPETGWETSSACLPKDVSLGVIFDHLRACGKQVTVKKPFTRGFNFFFWSYVHSVRVCKLNSSEHGPVKYFIRGKCWASQAKKENYSLECVLEAATTTYLMSVSFSHCSCPAGVSGSCHHLVALLLSIEHCAKKQQDVPSEQTCTTETQSWGPRPRQVVPQSVSSLVIEKAAMSKEADHSVRKASSLYEARAEPARTVSKEDFKQLLDSLLATGRRFPLQTLVSPDSDLEWCQSKMGAVPFGSVLCYQQASSTSVEVPLTCKRRHSVQSAVGHQTSTPVAEALPETSSSMPMFCDIPLPKTASSDDPLADCIPQSKAVAIERRTRDQGGSDLWVKMRGVTLTASKFHRIMHRREVTDAFVASLFEEKDLTRVAAVSHGHVHEETARNEYAERKRQTSSASFSVRQCGLVLHPAYQYIGASPDGQVHDPSCPDDPHGLVEIKCPHSAFSQDLTPAEACALPDFCCVLEDGKPALRRDHPYHYQIQGQLGVSGLSWCDFVVWTGPGRLSVERIPFDDVFWREYLLPGLLNFHSSHVKKLSEANQ